MTMIVALLASCAAGQRAPGEPDTKAALVAEWRTAPVLDGNHLRGSLVVINQSDDDFDQTVIVEAVNEAGKAFTLGYQHFNLHSHSRSATIRFETMLPPGRYSVRADAVAEVSRRNQIYRTALKAQDDFVVSLL